MLPVVIGRSFASVASWHISGRNPSEAGTSFPAARFLLLVRYGEGIVLGVDDEDSQQARRFAVARVLAHPVMRARQLVKAFADPIDPGGFLIDLAANGTGQHMSIDEGRPGMAMGRRLAAWRVGHDEGGQALSRDVRNGVLEDLFH